VNIKIGVRYEDFILGMSKKEVIRKFGNPSKIYFNDLDEPCFEYNEKQVILKFKIDFDINSPNNEKLSLIIIKDKLATIKGFYLWNFKKNKIKDIFEKELKTKAIMEDYKTVDTLYFEKFRLKFSFELGKLTSIHIK